MEKQWQHVLKQVKESGWISDEVYEKKPQLPRRATEALLVTFTVLLESGFSLQESLCCAAASFLNL